MYKKPLFHAAAAALYIVGIVYTIDAFTSISVLQKTLIIPMGMLGLFVLSAAIMGYLFAYEPFRLYFSDQKEAALRFFLQTVGIFACFVALFLVLGFGLSFF
jgi:hypothetical protein